MHIKDYIVIQKPISELRQAINSRILEGWIPIGGAQPISVRSTGVYIEYSQTMVLYSND